MRHDTSLARGCARPRTSVRSFVEGLERRLLFATIPVTNANDQGPGSLRQAILDANVTNVADTIVFDAAFFATARTINLVSALPQITAVGGALTIIGPGASLLTVRRNVGASFGIFNSTTPTLSLSGMTVSNGNLFGNGGGLAALGVQPAVTLDGMVFSGNTAGTNGDGGAVFVNNNGTLTIRN